MPDIAPSVNRFLPANGLMPVSFENAHGKLLMDGLRPQIHHYVGGASQSTDARIYMITAHLRTPAWQEAFGA